MSHGVARCHRVTRRGRKLSKDVPWCRKGVSQGAAATGERSFGHRGNVYFLLKLNPKLVSDHPESGRSETQLGIECLGRGAIVPLPQVGRVRGDQ